MSEAPGRPRREVARPAAGAGCGLIALTVAVTFVVTVGGLHPTNAERDHEVLAAAALIALASMPAGLLLVRSLRGREGADEVSWSAARLLVPIALAAVVLWLIAGVDMEPGGVLNGG
jgi:hypothetical protein